MERGTPGYELVDKTEELLLSIGRKLGIQNPFAGTQAVIKENREGRDQDSIAVERHENRWGQEVADISTDVLSQIAVGSAMKVTKPPSKVLRTYPPELTGTTTKGSITTVPQTRIDKFKAGTSPSTIGMQSAALNNLYYKLSNPGQGDLFEAAKLAQYQKDMRNFNISLPVRIDLANSVKGSAYRTSEPFDYFKFRDQSKYMRDKGRRFLAYFQAGLTQYGASKATNFDIYRQQETPKLKEEFQRANLKDSSFQIHHKAALKAIMGISHGLDFDSPVFREVMGIIIEEIPWLGLGDESTNLMPIVGSTADKGTPHYLSHKFYNEILGPKGQGEEFFTEEVIERMMVDREFRKEKAKEIGRIINRSNDIVIKATKLWELGFSNKHHFKSLEDLVTRLSQFDELGYEELSDPNYEAPIITAIIDEIVLDTKFKGPIVQPKSKSRNFKLENMLEDKRLIDEQIETDATLDNLQKGPKNPDQEELF